MAGSSPWIVDVTTQSFQDAVITRSTELPVIVDFWATWCQPCRQLAPMLEALANEYAGKFVLAKVNVDEAPEVAGAFGVQSIPHVFAVSDGRPVDQFVGVLSEPQLREWVKAIMPSPAEQLLKEAMALEAENPAAAEAKYREALDLVPDADAIKVRLATVLLAQNRDDECAKLIEELEQRGFLEPEAEKIKSQLELRAAAADAGGVDEARRTAEADPQDLSLRVKLADALAVARKHREALETCLDVIQRDKAGAGVDAKTTMVRIFDMLGPTSELASEFRRKLATTLY